MGMDASKTLKTSGSGAIFAGLGNDDFFVIPDDHKAYFSAPVYQYADLATNFAGKSANITGQFKGQ